MFVKPYEINRHEIKGYSMGTEHIQSKKSQFNQNKKNKTYKRPVQKVGNKIEKDQTIEE